MIPQKTYYGIVLILLDKQFNKRFIKISSRFEYFMESKHKIAISGANGFVGKNLRKLLFENNIPAICLARKNFQCYKNEQKIITTDYSEKKIFSKIDECSTFIHLVGIGRQDNNSDYISSNVNLTKKLLKICKKSKIKKFIFNSGLGVSSKPSTDYFKSKYMAEQEIINSKLHYTIFRPSYILGKDDYLTKNLKKQIKNGMILLPGTGKFLMQPIHINDACKIILQAVTSPKYSKKIIDLVGPDIITYKKLISKLKFKNIKKILLQEAYFNAIRNPNYIFGIDDLHILVGSFTGDFNKIKNFSGISFTNYVEALKTSGLS